MAKDFKIVEPEFVTKAKQSAVAAVEARFKREEESRRRAERRARAKGCLSWGILLAMAAAGGVYWACRHYGIDISEVGLRVQEELQTRRYERIEEVFRISPIADWRTVPEDLRPGKAATNTIYYAMLPADDGRMLLELTVAPGGSMSVRRLSAIADPVSLESDAFQRLTAKTPYLIQAGGNVYYCSGKKSEKKSSADKESFRSRLFSPVVAPEQKKGR